MCSVELMTHQLSVEKELSMYVTLLDCKKQEGVSTKESESLDKRIKERVKKIREAMILVECWNADAGNPDLGLNEADVLNNILPWHIGGVYKNCSLEFLRLKLYKMESETKRCVEELGYLPSDAVKVLLYFGRQIKLLQAWLMSEHALGSAPSGKVILMFEKMRKVERLYDDAFEQFVKCDLIQRM